MSNGNGSVNPSVAQPSQNAMETQLAAMLQQGGQVDQILQRSRSTLCTNDESDLYRRIVNDLESVRRAYSHPEMKFSCGVPPVVATPSYVTALKSALGNGSLIDLLFGYSLASHAGLGIFADSLYRKAWDEYRKQPTAYRKVLAEIIPQDFLSWAAEQLAAEAYRKGTNATAADDWDVFKGMLDSQLHHGLVGLGLPTGLPKLDAALNGLSGLVLVGGEPGAGKTTFAQSIVVAALQGDPDLTALIYSLDISKHLWFERLLCQRAGVDYQTLHHQQKSDETLLRLSEAEKYLRQEILPRMKIIEQPQDKDWFHELRASFNKLVRATGKDKILVVIDLFQRMDVSTILPDESEQKSHGKLLTDMQKDDFRLDAIKQFRDWSRNESMPAGPPSVVISEIRKGDDSKQDLTLEDIKGNGRIGFDADTVLLMMTPKNSGGSVTVPVNLRIAKARDGATRTDISLMFHHTVYKFTEIEPSSKKARATRATSDANSFDSMAGT